MVWRGTEGSCLAVAKRLRDGYYRPDVAGSHEVATACDVDQIQHLVLWRKKAP